MTIMVVKDTSLLQACWVGVDFETTVNAGVDDEVWLDTAIIIIFFFLDLFYNKCVFCDYRGGICPCRQCWRQCKIFASGVNLSIFTHFLCFFFTKTVKIR